MAMFSTDNTIWVATPCMSKYSAVASMASSARRLGVELGAWHGSKQVHPAGSRSMQLARNRLFGVERDDQGGVDIVYQEGLHGLLVFSGSELRQGL